MSEKRTLAKPVQSRPRRVHIILRDGDVVTGGLYLTDAQALAPYLGTRKNGWVNVVNATWQREGELHRHAVLQTEHIVMASAPDRDYPVEPESQVGIPRSVDVLLDDGTRVQGKLILAERQRLSDFLSTCGIFMPLLASRRVPDGDILGDIAVNSGCVKAVRDAKVFGADRIGRTSGGRTEWADTHTPQMTPAVVTPLNQEMVRRKTGDFMVITPGRENDRRLGEIPLPAEPVVREGASARLPLSAAERAREESLATHWLVRLTADAALLPPDPRKVEDAPTLGALWSAIAAANDVADGELAVIVGSTLQLDVADLDSVAPEALAHIPGKVARRLGVLPLSVADGFLVVAVSDPDSFEIDQQLRFLTKLRVRREVAPPAEIAAAIEWHYSEFARSNG